MILLENKDFGDSRNTEHTKTETKLLAGRSAAKKVSPRKAMRNTLAGTIALTLAAVPLIPAAQALNAADEQPSQASQQADYKGSDLVERFKDGATLTLAQIAEIDMDACKAADPQIAAKIIELKASLEAEAENLLRQMCLQIRSRLNLALSPATQAIKVKTAMAIPAQMAIRALKTITVMPPQVGKAPHRLL